MSEETAIAPVTVNTPGGAVTVTADQSPQERFAAFAKAYGAAETKAPPQSFGPEGPVVPGPMHFSGSAKPVAAKAAQQPAEDPAAKVAAFDAEMQAKGMQTPARAPDGKFVASRSVADPDDRLIDALNAAYRALTPEERQAKGSIYRAELAEAYEGRRLGETRGQFSARTAPAATSPTPVQLNYNAALDRAVAAQDSKGTLDHTAIGPELTHGYTLPPGKYVDLKDLLGGLKIARNRGWSQAQVEKILKETMT